MTNFTLPLAWDPAGIGDTPTGFALGILTLVVGVPAFFLLETWWNERRHRRFRSESGHRLVTRGVLICDWVDSTVLTTVAKQRGVAAEPIRLERNEGGTVDIGVEARAKRLGGRWSKERRHEVTEFYDLPQDPNALLVKVLGKLRDDEALTVDLEEAWNDRLPFNDDNLDEVIRTAKDAPEMEAARTALRALRQNMETTSLLERWRHAAELSPRFVLVETEWHVRHVPSHEPTTVDLSLAKLREREYPPDPYYGNPPETPTLIDLPPGVAMLVSLEAGRLTEQGRSRLKNGTIVKAGVLATTGVFDSEGSFGLTPIAVFARVE